MLAAASGVEESAIKGFGIDCVETSSSSRRERRRMMAARSPGLRASNHGNEASNGISSSSPGKPRRLTGSSSFTWDASFEVQVDADSKDDNGGGGGTPQSVTDLALSVSASLSSNLATQLAGSPSLASVVDDSSVQVLAVIAKTRSPSLAPSMSLNPSPLPTAPSPRPIPSPSQQPTPRPSSFAGAGPVAPVDGATTDGSSTGDEEGGSGSGGGGGTADAASIGIIVGAVLLLVVLLVAGAFAYLRKASSKSSDKDGAEGGGDVKIFNAAVLPPNKKIVGAELNLDELSDEEQVQQVGGEAASGSTPTSRSSTPQTRGLSPVPPGRNKAGVKL